MKASAKTDAKHHLTNQLQSVLSYVELDEIDKAIKHAKELLSDLHRIKAHRSAKATLTELDRAAAALAYPHIMMPQPIDGNVIVVPHGSRVVSHEDVNVDVASDEIRVVGPQGVRFGHGTHNPKTK
jgi:hypothetical protein